jgi:hypothetical protein
MRRTLLAAVTAAVLATITAPLAQATTLKEAGAVELGVIGPHRHVDEVRVMVDVDSPRPYAPYGRVLVTYPHRNTQVLYGWQQLALHDFPIGAIYEAHWRPDRDFPTGTVICAQSTAGPGEPCAVVHP